MSTDGANLDPATIDLDAWIDEIERPEVTVELYPREIAYQARLAELEALVDKAEDDPAKRGMDDPSPETVLAQIQDLASERAKSALRVRLRQLSNADLIHVAVRFKKAKIPEADRLLFGIAAHTIAPDYDGPLDAADVPQHFTHTQLKRLMKRDRSGEAMVRQLLDTVNELMRGLPVPS